MNPSINYILTQLSTDEASRERHKDLLWTTYGFSFSSYDESTISNLSRVKRIAFIRTALSRTVDGKAVLSGLEGQGIFDVQCGFESLFSITMHISDFLYEAFDYPLRTGQGLDKAIEALDKKMIELGIITI